MMVQSFKEIWIFIIIIIIIIIYAFFIQGSTIQWNQCFPRWPWYTICYNLTYKFMHVQFNNLKINTE